MEALTPNQALPYAPLPPDLALMIKAFITLEGMGRQLDPDFDIAGEAGHVFTVTMNTGSIKPRVVSGWGIDGSAARSFDGISVMS